MIVMLGVQIVPRHLVARADVDICNDTLQVDSAGFSAVSIVELNHVIAMISSAGDVVYVERISTVVTRSKVLA
jgi:hypothetical protein